MIRITIQTGAHTYRISNQSHEHDGYPWRGRLLNVPELELLGKVTDQENPVREIPLAIDNHDGFIDIDTDSIWNATVTYENDNYADTWVGILARYSESGEKTLSIQATEQTQALFKLMIPDEIVRIANYTDAPRDAANTTIPMIFGGTSASPIRTKAILVDRVNFRYIVCLGEIRQVVSVLKNRTAITEGFTSYTGTAGQATYPGFAYIEFASDPRDDAGVWPEILVDVVGLKLGTHTEEECRNPALILYYLLTTARTGACGWGLGRNVSELDAASFATAISDCDSAGFKIDGAMDEQKYAPQWIDRITSACRGSFGQKAGKWTLTIDKVSASVKHYGTGYAKMRVSTRGKGSMTNRKNQFVLNYRYDATDGRFLGFAQRDDVTSQNALGTTNKFEDTNKLVSDHTAAGYIVDYYKRYEEYGEDRIEFTTSDFSGVSKDSVIEITRADFGYSAKKFRVVSISIGKRTAKIEARSYDDAIFDNDTPGTPPADPETDPTIPAAAPPNPPGVPADLSLQTNVRVQPDGLTIIYVDGTFTSAIGTLYVKVEVGEGSNPTSWFEWGNVSDGGTFHHEPCKPGQVYTYRLTAINAGGSSAPITASITSAGDTTAPAAPTVVATGKFTFATLKITLQNPPADLAGFRVYRGVTENVADAEYLASVSSRDGVAEYSDHLPNYTQDYIYFARSYDCWRNIGEASSASAPVRGARILAADILRKLTPADALNTDPYFEDTTAWSNDLAGAVADPAHFATVTDGIAGGTEFKTTSGERIAFGVSLDGLAPYDSTRKYVLTAFIRATGGGSHGLGFAFYDSAKTLLGTTSAQDNAIAATATWTEFSKTFSTAPSGTRYIGPAFTCNDGTTAGVIVEIQKARLREVLTADILIANEAIITSAIQIAEGIINDAHIANLAAEKITTGTLDTARLSAAVAAVSQLTALGKNLTEDPSFLDFQNSFAMDGTATEAVVGRWTIAGDAAIPVNGVSVLTATNKPTLVMTGKGIKMRPFAASTGNRLWLAQNVAVRPNEPYCFSAHVTRDDAVPTDVTPPYVLIIEWRSSAGYLSQVAATNDAPGRFYVSGTAPETASYAILYVMLPAHTPVSGYGANMVVSAVQFERASVATFWVGREQGTITADRIFTGILRSMNYGASAGSEIDLDSGTFKFGGSTAPKLSWNGTKLEMVGKAVIDEGSIGGFDVGEDALTAGTSATAIGMSTDTDKAAFWAGGETAADAPFRIDHAGTGRVGVFEFTDTQFQSSLEDELGVYPVITIVPEGSYSSPQIELTNKDNFDQYGTFIYYGLKFGEFLFSIIRLMAQATGADAANAQVILNGMSSTEYSLAATGIVQGYISNLSDKKLKKDFSRVSTLEKLKQLNVSEWSYDEDAIESRSIERQRIEILQREGKVVTIPRRRFRKDEGHRHIGPTAEEFNTLFGVAGGNTESIGVGDQIGVVMRAVQELSDIVEAQAGEIAELREHLGIPRKMAVESRAEERVRVTDEEAELIRHAENMSDDARKHVAKHTEDIMREIRKWKEGRKA